VRYPDVAKEWHPTKNGQLKPTLVAPMSHKKVWWICSKKHEWQASVANRTRGTGCPYCAGKKVGTDNNLAYLYPTIADQWHPTKNECTPYEVTSRSGLKVWWVCAKGHEWLTQISHRTMGGGCPFCHPQTSKLEIRFYTELKWIFQDVKWRNKIKDLECDIFLPQYKLAIEIDGYPWHEGQEKRDKAKTKQLKQHGIICIHVRDSRLIPLSSNDILFKARERAFRILHKLLTQITEQFSLDPKEAIKLSQYLQENKLQNRQEYKTIVSTLPEPLPKQSVAHLYPHIAEQWHPEKNNPLKPTLFTPGSGTQVWWQCSQGHEWRAQILSRTRGAGCPFCSGRHATQNNNLAVAFPQISSEWHPTKNTRSPEQVKPFSNQSVWWLCGHKHEYQARVSHRTRGSGCPQCRKEHMRQLRYKTALQKSGSLAEHFSELVTEWHPIKNESLTPFDVTPGSHRKVWWQCAQGHEWQAVIYSRSHGTGCPHCYRENPSRSRIQKRIQTSIRTGNQRILD